MDRLKMLECVRMEVWRNWQSFVYWQYSSPYSVSWGGFVVVFFWRGCQKNDSLSDRVVCRLSCKVQWFCTRWHVALVPFVIMWRSIVWTLASGLNMLQNKLLYLSTFPWWANDGRDYLQINSFFYIIFVKEFQICCYMYTPDCII